MHEVNEKKKLKKKQFKPSELFCMNCMKLTDLWDSS